MRPITPSHERVLRRTDRSNAEGCWLWTGRLGIGGYGQVRAGGRGSGMPYAHRVVYEALVGPVPDGLKIDHICHTRAYAEGRCDGGICRHRACVNPKHLEAVSQRVNLLRGNTGPAANAAKTHCLRDHPFSGPNLIIRKSGKRECRTCANASRRKTGQPTTWPGESDPILRHRFRPSGA